MFFKTLLWKTINHKFKEFCKHCTLHGVYYFYDNTRWWIHGIWVFILACSLLLCGYLSHMIWDKFVIDPTLTVVETTHYSTALIPFPAVSVCNTELVYGPKTDNVTLLLSLRGYNKTQISEFFQSFSKLKLKDYVPMFYVKKMHFLLEDLGYPLNTLLLMFKKPCEELLRECSWRSRPYNCTDMFRSVYTMMGHCCQFDITYFKKNVNTQTNFVPGVQPTEALDIVVDGQTVSANGEFSNGYASIYVFDENDSITFVNNAITLTPDAYFDVNVYLWTIDSSSYVRALELDKRKCILNTDPAGKSYQGCLAKNTMRVVVDQCKCLPFNFTAEDLEVNAYTQCTWDRLRCIYQNLESVQADIRVVTAQSECYQKCEYVQYETEVEFIKNRRSLKAPNTRSRVVVHFSETTCMKYRREVLYTWDQMLANLGGIFGLCLGGSIISIIEIIWFILDLIFTIINDMRIQRKADVKYKRNMVHPRKSNSNKIFTLTQNNMKIKSSNVVRYKFTN